MAQHTTYKGRKRKRLAIRYRDELWRVTAALIAAVVTGLSAGPSGLPAESSTPNLLSLIAVYFSIAYVGLLWIRQFTVLLDRYFPWPVFPASRVAFQLFLCWLLPMLLVYGLVRVALSHPSLAVLAQYTVDSHETGAVLVVSLTLSCNIAYACAYFIALCRLLQKKIRRALHLIMTLRSALREKERELAALKQELLQKGEKPSPDTPLDGRYRHETPTRIELVDYGDITKFELEEKTVFIYRKDAEKEPAKEKSLTAVEQATGGYFRKIGRNHAIGLHALKRCRQNERGQFELELEHEDTPILVSADYARKLKPWILQKVKIERKPPERP